VRGATLGVGIARGKGGEPIMKALAILVAIIAVPIAEIWIAVALAKSFGWATVLIAMAVFFGFGIAMVQRATRAWRRTIERAQADPGYVGTGFNAAMGDAAVLFTGAILMLIPGFLTGVVGLLLVIPPIRKLVIRGFHGRIEKAASARGYRKVTIIEGETVVRETYVYPDTFGASGESPGASGDAGPQPPSQPGPPKVIMGEIVERPDEPPKDQ